MLVVDEDPRTARRLAQMLREDGYDAEVAFDGSAAIARFTRSPLPEALVTALRMPNVDGLAVMRYARSQKPGVPIFVVTGYPHLMSSAPFEDPRPLLFTKPVVYDELENALGAALGACAEPR